MDPEGILLHLEVEPFTKNPVIKPSSQFLIYWIVQPSNPSISNLKTRMFCGIMSEPYRSWGRWYQFLFSLVLWYSHSIIKVHWILITPLLFLLPACFSISWLHLESICFQLVASFPPLICLLQSLFDGKSAEPCFQLQWTRHICQMFQLIPFWSLTCNTFGVWG